MEKPFFREIITPNLENPVFIQGLPGFGNVGRIAANLLVNISEAKLFAEFYSPFFPDYVTVSSEGICNLPKYEFYSATMENTNIIIMTGETQPSFDDVLAHYQVCSEIIEFIKKLGCNFMVTMGGVPIVDNRDNVYVAATSSRLIREFKEQGATIYEKGKIVGAAGLTLALAKQLDIEGVCLLGSTTGFKADRGASYQVFKLLMKFLGKEIKEG
ncbi:PAC2 family protein [Candidatus Bathyarchaeota archaeon]|nr:PAC2 family protein [Candidatus Bathyarchaeota archaeon]